MVFTRNFPWVRVISQLKETVSEQSNGAANAYLVPDGRRNVTRIDVMHLRLMKQSLGNREAAQMQVV